jgi:hypothetical protein
MDTSHPSRSKGKRPALVDKSESQGREAYLISLASKEDARPFGTVRGKETVLNDGGKALAACWRELGRLRPGLRPDSIRIGARLVQGILILSQEGAEAPSLSEAIRLFKVISSLRVQQIAKGSAALRDKGNKGDRGAKGNKSGTDTLVLPGKSPSALWKKGYSERRVSGAADLAEARKSLR